MKSNLGQDRVIGLQELDRLLSGGDQDLVPDGTEAEQDKELFPTITEEQTGHFVPPSPFDKTQQTVDASPEKAVIAGDSTKKSQTEPDFFATEQMDVLDQTEPKLVSGVARSDVPKFEN